LFVTAPMPVPTTTTCAPASGRSEPDWSTTPVTVPVACCCCRAAPPEPLNSATTWPGTATIAANAANFTHLVAVLMVYLPCVAGGVAVRTHGLDESACARAHRLTFCDGAGTTGWFVDA